jgi:outer membrane protein OmpA-like peptidoglycan-associated protein
MFVVLKKEKIEIKKQVHFATGKDVILPDSAPLLDEVASTILANPRLKVIRIEGHTDDQGDDSYNLELSQRRAGSVARALIERGVEAGRLKAVGFGETKPIESNKKPAGRAKNRRVEFMIEDQG